ncbi:MAG: hypothetical protein A3F17_02285 [Gammaproteobacteria bacterium RIFCSPHIGHO2_12_FULL_41_15]|nr:MAG: hypothetical protein A3F17_02285 [Gammaproteobacteria bacterium RIFCSPHIGHO2_12_FULL_41_15]
MLNPKTINDFVKDVCDNLPPAIKKMPENIEQKVRAAMLSTFAKMDLVTRDEFDAQVKVLERTRIKLEEMETRLAKYEKNKFPDK